VYVDRHVKSLTFLYSCNQNQNISRILVEIPNMEVHENPYGVSCAVPRGRTDRRTRHTCMTRQIVTFRNCFARAPKNCILPT